MQATSTNPVIPPPPPAPSKSKLRKIGFFLAFLIVVGSLGAAIFWHGNRKPHTVSHHKLYSSFEDSPSHKKLLTTLNKASQSIIIGKKQHGLFEFAQHLANHITQKGRSVIIEGYSSNTDKLLELSRTVIDQVSSKLGIVDNNTDWIIVSQAGQLIPEQKINQIKTAYPSSRIIILTTNTQQKIKGFKQHQYTKIDPKIIKKAIAKSYKVKDNIAEILHQFYDNHDQLFSELNPQKFDHKQHLGEDFKAIDKLNKQESAVVAELCKNGPKKNKKAKQVQSLASYGVIFVGDKHIWQTQDALLNYELNTGSNCVNKVATEQEVKAYTERKQKQEEQKKAKEEEERKKQQERKAAQQKKQQEQQRKKEEELKKKEEAQKLKQSAAQAKAQKPAGDKKKQAKAPAKASKKK